MRVITTTVKRHTRYGEEPTGRVLDVDFEGRTILNEHHVRDPVDPSANPNPRGGARGGRGVRVRKGRIYVANYDTVFMYDMDWRPRGEITSPLTAGIHEIWSAPDGLWLSLTQLDLAVKLDGKGKVLKRWYPREDRELMRSIGSRVVPELDWDTDWRRTRNEALNSLHLNSVIETERELWVLFGMVKRREREPKEPRYTQDDAKRIQAESSLSRWYHRAIKDRLSRTRWHKRRMNAGVGSESVVVRIDRRTMRPRVLFRSPAFIPDHNAVPWDERTILLNKTSLQELYVIDRRTGALVRTIRIPGNHLRGLHRVDENRLLVGTGPATLFLVDLRKGRVVDSMRLSSDPNEAIHGLCVVE